MCAPLQSFNNHVSKDIIHKGLKCWWGIAEAKEHDCGFKEAKGSNECCFPLVKFPDVNVVIPPSDVELHEKGGVFHIVNKFRDKGQWVHVVDGMGVTVSVILAGGKGTILLGNEEEWYCLRRF